MTKWKTEKQSASSFRVSPANETTRGRFIKRGTKKVVNRAATALPLAAQTLRTSKTFLRTKHRRLRGHMDAAQAITAVAHNHIYRILKFGHNYAEGEPSFMSSTDNITSNASKKKQLSRASNRFQYRELSQRPYCLRGERAVEGSVVP